MRSLLLPIAALLTAAPAFAAEQRYAVTDFDRIRVDGPFQVQFVTGRPATAIAQGRRDAIDRVSIDVQGNTLRVRANTAAWGERGAAIIGPLTILLTTRELRAVAVNGAGTLSGDKVKAMRFDVLLSGSGSIDIQSVESDSLVLNTLGSGNVRIAGRTKNVRAEIRGSGNLEGEGLTASDAQIFADSAGTIRLNATRSANVVASASGDVAIAGRAACTVKQTGSGNVTCGK